MNHVVLPADVNITRRLHERTSAGPDYRGENLAITDLARHMADQPSEVLPRLVKLALGITKASSAGVSILQGKAFRWVGLHGLLSRFEGATTPRNDSPCGVCIDALAPILMEHPERAYAWIRDAGIIVPEVLLVPLLDKAHAPLGTLWVVAREGQAFNAEDARLLSSLAVFAGIAVSMIKADEDLKAALERERTLAREMKHRVGNIYTVVSSVIRMTARVATSTEQLAEALQRRVQAMADAHGLAGAATDEASVPLVTVIETMLGPYRMPRLSGPDVKVTADTARNLALVFHELATNAAKHGAFSTPAGTLDIRWTVDDDKRLTLVWEEQGGPSIAGRPARLGFGSTLISSIVTDIGGSVTKTWLPTGVVATLTVPDCCEQLES